VISLKYFNLRLFSFPFSSFFSVQRKILKIEFSFVFLIVDVFVY
jgi:hypothetical protein